MPGEQEHFQKGQAIFITGTDTGVGKTLVSALLLNFIRKKGIDASYQKWVSTGGRDSEDLNFCFEVSGMEKDDGLLDRQVPYRFSLPASPHLSAEMENEEIEPDIIVKRFQEMLARHEVLIVEGVGGLLVPLRRDLLLIDLISRLGLQTLLVARSGLGTLNHTFLSLEAMRKREIPVLGVVFSDSSPNEEDLIVQDNMKTIAELGAIQVFGRLPWCESLDKAKIAFKSIGEEFYGAQMKGAR